MNQQQSDKQTLKITLLPLGRFFFGGEVVFGGDNAQGERSRSYLVHSRIFPQQTSLLGMLREQLLRQNGLLAPYDSKKKKEEAIQLVGKRGFGINQIKDAAVQQARSFGCIRQLSPLFLMDETGILYQPIPLDDNKGKNDQSLKWNIEEGHVLLENFDPKNGLGLRFAPESHKNNPQSIEDFFVEQHQVGITVTNRLNWRADRKDNKEAFFKQSYYRNGNSTYATSLKDLNSNKQYAFSFWVEVDTEILSQFQPLKDAIVTLGGERSSFKMKVETVKNSDDFSDQIFNVKYRCNNELNDEYNRILLLSDTYLPKNEIKSNALFVVANTIQFRFFTTDLEETTHFYQLKRGNDKTPLEEVENGWKKNGRRQSKLYTLMEKGGVLLVKKDQVDTVLQSIKKQSAFLQVGYNYVQKI